MTGLALAWHLAQGTVARLVPLLLRFRTPALGTVVVLAGLWFGVDRQAPDFAFALPPGLRAAFALVNEVGRTWWMLLLCAVVGAYALWTGRRALGAQVAFIAFAVAMAGLVTNVLKLVFARARPWRLVEDGSFGCRWFDLARGWDSFPSGHSTAIFALAFSLGALHPRLAPVLILAALPVAFARVVMTNHYPSDVVAGIAVAALVTAAARDAFVSHGLLPERLPARGARGESDK